ALAWPVLLADTLKLAFAHFKLLVVRNEGLGRISLRSRFEKTRSSLQSATQHVSSSYIQK
ncbi:hypothetical protein ACO2IY_17550, partial [Leptospira interrogans]|uniref:hypothetical protein n=1 Tax=Leptospira interrogans TaxID=173 RepID=UPI003D063BB1